MGVDVREAIAPAGPIGIEGAMGKKEELFSVQPYLCTGAAEREMHDDGKDIYGGLRSGICLRA